MKKAAGVGVVGAAMAAVALFMGAGGSADAAKVEARCHDGQVVTSLSNPFTWGQHKAHGDWLIQSASDRAACESGIPIPPLNSGYIVACEDGGTDDQEVVLVGYPYTLGPDQVRITTLTQLAECQPVD